MMMVRSTMTEILIPRNGRDEVLLLIKLVIRKWREEVRKR